MRGPQPGPASSFDPRWAAWHLHLGVLGAPATDQLVHHVVAPAVDWCRAPGRSVTWFFVRYWQFGPHIRLRIAGLDGETESRLDAVLRACMAAILHAAPAALTTAEYQRQAGELAAAGEGRGPLELGEPWPPGVYRQRYRPEAERYGGAGLMPLSESLFQSASELALAFTRHDPPEAARSGLGLRATWAAIGTLGDDDRRLRFCRRAAAGWQTWAAGGRGEIVPAVRAPSGLPSRAPAPVTRWADQLGSAMTAWRAATSQVEAERILHAHIHMLHNRLGLSIGQEVSHYLALGDVLAPMTDQLAVTP